MSVDFTTIYRKSSQDKDGEMVKKDEDEEEQEAWKGFDLTLESNIQNRLNIMAQLERFANFITCDIEKTTYHVGPTSLFRAAFLGETFSTIDHFLSAYSPDVWNYADHRMFTQTWMERATATYVTRTYKTHSLCDYHIHITSSNPTRTLKHIKELVDKMVEVKKSHETTSNTFDPHLITYQESKVSFPTQCWKDIYECLNHAYPLYIVSEYEASRVNARNHNQQHHYVAPVSSKPHPFAKHYLKPFQQEAVQSMFRHTSSLPTNNDDMQGSRPSPIDTIASGCIVLPCGSGKTMVGASVVAQLLSIHQQSSATTSVAIQKKTFTKKQSHVIILTPSNLSAKQWYQTVIDQTSLNGDHKQERDEFKLQSNKYVHKNNVNVHQDVYLLVGQDDQLPFCDSWQLDRKHQVVIIVSYHRIINMLNEKYRNAKCFDGVPRSDQKKSPKRLKRMDEWLKWIYFHGPWSLIIYDEVHMACATNYSKTVTDLYANIKLGLTATLFRSDSRISIVDHFIGPVLYKMSWLEAQRSGAIAQLVCMEIQCPLPQPFQKQMKHVPQKKQERLLAFNPNKLHIAQYLIDIHRQQNHKILVIVTSLSVLHKLSEMWNFPLIDGKMSEQEKQSQLHKFRTDPKCLVLLGSSIMDEAIDIPEATVLIEVSIQVKTATEATQRLGRISRKKLIGPNIAYNYTLVSCPTELTTSTPIKHVRDLEKELDNSKQRRTWLERNGIRYETLHQNDLSNLDAQLDTYRSQFVETNMEYQWLTQIICYED